MGSGHPLGQAVGETSSHSVVATNPRPYRVRPLRQPGRDRRAPHDREPGGGSFRPDPYPSSAGIVTSDGFEGDGRQPRAWARRRNSYGFAVDELGF